MRAIVLEPQCIGFEHVAFNVALLSTALLAYPQDEAVFAAEAGHLALVRDALAKRCDVAPDRVQWREVDVPARRLDGRRRLPHEWAWCRELAELASQSETRFALLSSITDAGLFALSTMLRRRAITVPTLAVLHSVLASMERPLPRLPWNRRVRLPGILRRPAPPGLTYIALGEPIYRHAIQIAPYAAERFRCLEQPRLWDRVEIAPDPTPGRLLRFGFFGVVNRFDKGFDLFLRLAEEVPVDSVAPRAEFVLVGFLGAELAHAMPDATGVQGLGNAPLTPDEYAQRADSLDYAVWTGNPEAYRLTASAAFTDAISYIKPCICLRAPYIEHYFERMGDIGYLCDSYEDMRELISSLVAAPPTERYRRQCRNILAARSLFEPRTLAPTLRALVEDAIARVG